MKIRLFSSVHGGIFNGFSNGSYYLHRAIKELGHEVIYDGNEYADVSISFSQPHWYDESPGAYRIGYTPWESTELKEGWLEEMQAMDEIWTPSDLIAEWFKSAGITKPIYVVPHGISPLIKTTKHERSGPLKFLHIGEPAERKGGEEAWKAFRSAFKDRSDVSLTFKSGPYHRLRVYDNNGSILGNPDDKFYNINSIKKDLVYSELIALYNEYDALIYPSWGEGFGMIPSEALAAGMPVITVHEWAPYREFITSPGISVDLVDSPWSQIHPGKMFRPDMESISDLYLDMYLNYDTYADKTYEQASAFRSEYDWNTVVNRAITDLEKRLN